MEVTYKASVLKGSADTTPEEELQTIFGKAMRTLKAKMNELLLS
jgi:hypothetical protein